MDACEPATFGLNDSDVLDPSYRAAGKIDNSNFATKIELEKLGLMDTIRYALLKGDSHLKPFFAELYKLNVYGAHRHVFRLKPTVELISTTLPQERARFSRRTKIHQGARICLGHSWSCSLPLTKAEN